MAPLANLDHVTRALLSGGMLIVASIAAAQERDPHTVQPERPTIATHAGTVAPGWLEIESGIERDHFSGAPSVTTTPTVFKFGIAPRAQLSIGATVVHTVAGTGAGDLYTGIKVRLVEDAPILGDFAILPSITFPTGSEGRGFGSGERQGGLLLISSHQFGNVALDVNVGFDAPHGWPEHASLWTVSFGGPLFGSVGWVLESFGFNDERKASLLAGPTYSLANWLALDSGLIVPLRGAEPRALYAGAVCNVGRFFPTRVTR